MTHVFVAPHPDDVALSCGGLIASLRELGQNVAILTVFSGNTESDDLTTYQREALGFGGKTLWPATEAFNRSSILADYPTAAAVTALSPVSTTMRRPLAFNWSIASRVVALIGSATLMMPASRPSMPRNITV